MIEEPEPPFVLTAQERDSPLWAKIKTEAETRLAELRAKNDGALEEIQTATLRGEIKFLKWLIALGNELPPVN